MAQRNSRDDSEERGVGRDVPEVSLFELAMSPEDTNHSVVAGSDDNPSSPSDPGNRGSSSLASPESVSSQ